MKVPYNLTMKPRQPQSENSVTQPKDLLDRSFEIGIILKGLNGALELVGGLLLLLISPSTINNIIIAITQGELSEDPRDFVASHLILAANHLSGSPTIFGAIYLLSHGAVKIVLVIAVLKNKIWAYPWMIGFLLVFILYQLYRITFAPSFGLIALTIFDILIVWLTYLEYQKHRPAQNFLTKVD